MDRRRSSRNSPGEGPSRPPNVPARRNFEEADLEDEGVSNAVSTSDGRLRPTKRRRQRVPQPEVPAIPPVSLPESAPATRLNSPVPEPSQPAIEDPNENPPVNPDAPHESNDTPQNEDSVNLTDVENHSTLAEVLSRQRQDAVLAQTERAQSGSILTAYQCPICMDQVVDATTTACGHLFCHKCIMDAVRYNYDIPGDRPPRGNCPACRKPITGNDRPGRQRFLIPLQFKLSTRLRK